MLVLNSVWVMNKGSFLLGVTGEGICLLSVGGAGGPGLICLNGRPGGFSDSTFWMTSSARGFSCCCLSVSTGSYKCSLQHNNHYDLFVVETQSQHNLLMCAFFLKKTPQGVQLCKGKAKIEVFCAHLDS